MPTSGEQNWTRTVGETIKSAMVELGALSMGDEPEDSEYDEALPRLAGLLKELATQGALYRDAAATVVIPGASGGATLPDDVADLSSARVVVSGSHQRLLSPWNRAEYYMIPNRSQTGTWPVAYYVNKTIDALEIKLWPVPTADVTLHLDYRRAVDVPTEPTETLDVPQDWQNAIMLNLASRLANMFSTTRVDPGVVARVDAQAGAALTVLLDADRPDSYYFEPWDSYA
jgi:hypothetical protein